MPQILVETFRQNETGKEMAMKRVILLIKGMMMAAGATIILVMTAGCVSTTCPPPPPWDGYSQADYTNRLEVATATIGDYRYTYLVTNGSALIIGPHETFELHGKYQGTRHVRAISPEPTGVLSIPAFLDGYPVKFIGMFAFGDCSKIKGVIIPPGVTSIGDHAFMGCSSLRSVDIPSSVASIGRYAFWGCVKLKCVDIPSSVTDIKMYAFEDCTSLKSVVIPSDVIVGRCAFPEWCKVQRK